MRASSPLPSQQCLSPSPSPPTFLFHVAPPPAFDQGGEVWRHPAGVALAAWARSLSSRAGRRNDAHYRTVVDVGGLQPCSIDKADALPWTSSSPSSAAACRTHTASARGARVLGRTRPCTRPNTATRPDPEAGEPEGTCIPQAFSRRPPSSRRRPGSTRRRCCTSA